MGKSKTKLILKKIFKFFGIDIKILIENFNQVSLRLSLLENRLSGLAATLRELVPDISHQEETEEEAFTAYSELKRRILQAFQCSLMLKVLESFSSRKLTVADIGDSAGTHLFYLKELAKERFDVEGIGVNLDPRAIKKIKSRGFKAILCRAEDLDLRDTQVDLFTSFEMVEHLHNPALFFRRLAKKSQCKTLIITVPYFKKSRVGLYHVRVPATKPIYAGDEHIFELSPQDWSLLMLHSGWRVRYSKIYYQYPKRIPIISNILSWYWKRFDFEGFWGAILEKDTSISDYYQDW